jgi:hypothetical protein
MQFRTSGFWAKSSGWKMGWRKTGTAIMMPPQGGTQPPIRSASSMGRVFGYVSEQTAWRDEIKF